MAARHQHGRLILGRAEDDIQPEQRHARPLDPNGRAVHGSIRRQDSLSGRVSPQGKEGGVVACQHQRVREPVGSGGQVHRPAACLQHSGNSIPQRCRIIGLSVAGGAEIGKIQRHGRASGIGGGIRLLRDVCRGNRRLHPARGRDCLRRYGTAAQPQKQGCQPCQHSHIPFFVQHMFSIPPGHTVSRTSRSASANRRCMGRVGWLM